MNRPTLTDAEVESGYNNRAAVPDHARWLARYPEWSARTRDRWQSRCDIAYGPGPLEKLDLFLPEGRARGTFMFIHGGYWRMLDKSDVSFVADALLAQGIAVATLNYDLCPAVSIATIVDQCQRAVSWMARHGAAHGADVGNVVVGGHSAGGHLAAMMFTRDWAAAGFAQAPFRAGLTLSGVHDLVPLVQFSFNADFKLDVAGAVEVSPAEARARVRAPLLMACGAAETSEFLRQTRLLWDAWPEVRRPMDAPLLIDGKDHFSVVAEFTNPESVLTRATLALF